MKYTHWINFSDKNRSLHLFICLLYFLLVVLPHDWLGRQIGGFFRTYGRDNYNMTILIICLLGLALVIGFSLKSIVSSSNKNSIIQVLSSNLILTILSWYYLFVVNIEAIHFLQYAIFAILIFPIKKHFLSVLSFCFLAGTIDESYQYFHLIPEKTEYFDMNDVILDMLGGCWGILMLKIWKCKQEYNRYWYLPILLVIFSFACLFLSPILSLYPSDDMFAFIKSQSGSFWTSIPPQVIYHVIGLWEGIAVMGLLFGWYAYLFKK